MSLHAICWYQHVELAKLQILISALRVSVGNIIFLAQYVIVIKLCFAHDHILVYLNNIQSSIPVRWSAPEALSGGILTPGSDVWGFGVLMWETVTSAAKRPYDEWDDKTVSCGDKCIIILYIIIHTIYVGQEPSD